MHSKGRWSTAAKGTGQRCFSLKTSEISQWVGAHQRIHQLRAENIHGRIHGSGHGLTAAHVLRDLMEDTRVKGQARVQTRVYKHRVVKALLSGWPSQRTG